MADVATKIITGNSIKVKDVMVVKTGGGNTFQSKSTGVTNTNLATQMDTKYDTKFDNSDFHAITTP